ncbi:hypothetical protein AB685_19625 [Bacillus sp. LL01]|nr:hypothetical protein AB685_19625 [Bacillus sp. LL01]
MEGMGIMNNHLYKFHKKDFEFELYMLKVYSILLLNTIYCMEQFYVIYCINILHMISCFMQYIT